MHRNLVLQKRYDFNENINKINIRESWLVSILPPGFENLLSQHQDIHLIQSHLF